MSETIEFINKSHCDILDFLEIELVDELGQPIDDVEYSILLDDDGSIINHGRSDGNGKVRVKTMPNKPVRLVLNTEQLLNSMQRDDRYLRLSRIAGDSIVKMRAEKEEREYFYTPIGKLIEGKPNLNEWPDESALPAFHFPDLEPKGWLILPIKKENKEKQREITFEVCPFRVWVFILDSGVEYSLSSAYNLALMSILAYANREYDEHGSRTGAFRPYVEQELTNVGCLPFKVNNQYLSPIVKDVPFKDRYCHYGFIDTSTQDMGEVGDTQLFYLTCSEHSIISWRGTASIKDGFTDIKFIQDSIKPLLPSGMVHRGFKSAYQNVSSNDELIRNFEKMSNHLLDKPIFICGHSLGGALALLNAIEYKERNPILYTYGMPRAIDRVSVSWIKDLTHYRHVNNNDPIPTIPYPKFGVMGALIYLNMSVLPFFSPTAIPSRMRSYLDSDQYNHHGHPIYFIESIIRLDNMGAGRSNDIAITYESQRRFLSKVSQSRNEVRVKTLLAPSLIKGQEGLYRLIMGNNKKLMDGQSKSKLFDSAEHGLINYAGYLGERVYEHLCQGHSETSYFEWLSKEVKNLVSIDDNIRQLNTRLLTDSTVLELSMLPNRKSLNEINGIERFYRHAMRPPIDKIQEEKEKLIEENKILLSEIQDDANYKLYGQSVFLEPGVRSGLPKISDSIKGKIRLAKRQLMGLKKIETLLNSYK